ncbi:RNA polymerase sigma-70 factor (ECF subfamily) [Haloactinopolyspora alba]|uniref:RNA polymerase sigma-70 factor (ECF subfamily) n=1 Tax=Haloactinopolyspora alba TaxID=648780 RepID=A0A2P8DZ05_9ACTN|nr:RNA polymerase sigma-70 factor [Haloactinopolyspora alba]PSL02452.1 RNA polymerase sigma-70 factor (ECF subfamily) [Haloactinopolyspora alba]
MAELAAVHDELRPLMFSIAYRMLGSVTEAEDVVQEAFLRMHRAAADGTDPDNAEAYATTVTTRLAIDALRSARRRREAYIGSWLPEPWLTSGDEPAERAERTDTLSTALLVVLETLSPVERAVFLLREVFEYGYAEIAAIVDRTEPMCRQSMARAQQHLDRRRPRFDPSREQRDRLAGEFVAACGSGDVEALKALLAEDVVFHGDGGGRAPAVRHPVSGALQVARFVAGLARQAARANLELSTAHVNGQPGLITSAGDGVLGVMSMVIVDGRIRSLHNVINPDKLQHLGPVGDINTHLSGPAAGK